MALTTLKQRIKTLGNRTAVMVPGSWRTSDMTAADRGYDHTWRKAREGWLRKHPLCVYCEREGRVTAATILDHIIPHRGNQELFWASETNWQSLCKTHHDGQKAQEEAAQGYR